MGPGFLIIDCVKTRGVFPSYGTDVQTSNEKSWKLFHIVQLLESDYNVGLFDSAKPLNVTRPMLTANGQKILELLKNL